MKYKAVIFDFHGTIVSHFSNEMYCEMLAQMADALAVDRNSFIRSWMADGNAVHQRMCGHISFEQSLKDTCSLIKHSLTPQDIEAAWQSTLSFSRRHLEPRPDLLSTLGTLKASGYKLGLITNCSWEAPVIWQELPLSSMFDAAVHSCETGLLKPDPAIYHLACKRLGVLPGECLYVGDDPRSELPGALNAGMEALLLYVPSERNSGLRCTDHCQWQGAVIESLGCLIDHIK